MGVDARAVEDKAITWGERFKAPALFFKDEINGQHQKGKPNKVVQSKTFRFKEHYRKNYKYHQGYYFLNDFQLYQRKGAAIFTITNPIGRNLQYIFEKRNPPANEYNRGQPDVFAPLHVFELQMPVPGQSHKSVGEHKK